MINVKQIFESAILNEALGNLNKVSDPTAKRIIVQLLKDRQIRNTAWVTQDSAVEDGGSYKEDEFTKTLKKVTNLGKRVGMIVFVAGESSVGVVIRDDQYVQDGAVRKTLKVYSVVGNRMSTTETTLGKVMAEVDSSSKVYFVLVDDNYASKLSRQGNQSGPDNSDKYELRQYRTRYGVETSPRTNFMDNARSAGIVVDLDKTSPLVVLAKILRAENQRRELTLVKNNQEYNIYMSQSHSNTQSIVSKIEYVGVQEVVVVRGMSLYIKGATPDDGRFEYYDLVLNKQGNFILVKQR